MDRKCRWCGNLRPLVSEFWQTGVRMCGPCWGKLFSAWRGSPPRNRVRTQLVLLLTDTLKHGGSNRGEIQWCNKCGKPRVLPCAYPTAHGPAVQFTTGYFSPALPDGNVYSFTLCEPCVAALMKTFRIPAQVREYL